jgi:hypothetical protein
LGDVVEKCVELLHAADETHDTRTFPFLLRVTCATDVLALVQQKVNLPEEVVSALGSIDTHLLFQIMPQKLWRQFRKMTRGKYERVREIVTEIGAVLGEETNGDLCVLATELATVIQACGDEEEIMDIQPSEFGSWSHLQLSFLEMKTSFARRSLLWRQDQTKYAIELEGSLYRQLPPASPI